MKMFVKAALVGALSLASGMSGPVFAQGASSCAVRSLIVDRLASKYGETRQSAGLNQNNGMVEVFASEETGTWTILVTMPTGVSCLMAAGKAWQGMADLADPTDQGA